MTPAEQLAKSKPRRRFRKSESTKGRKKVLDSKLIELRQSMGLTLRDVSQALSMSQANLHAVEHGAETGLTFALKLSAFYGKPITDLWALKTNGSTVAGVADRKPSRKADSQRR